MKRTIRYRRTSAQEQSNGFGLDTQLDKMNAYCALYDYDTTNDDDIITDEAVTGTTDDRPGLKRLLEMIEAGEVERVVVYKLDRMARRLFILLDLYENYFKKHNVALVSVMEQFDTSTPMGRMFFHILGSFAEYEKDVIVERLAGGRLTKLNQGDRATGSVALGYTVEEVAGRKHTVVNQKEAETVRTIHELKDQGMKLAAIARLLNEKGVPTKRGGQWYASTVKYIVENNVYAGTVQYRSNTGETFSAVAEALKVLHS